jgi:hypothetical protein
VLSSVTRHSPHPPAFGPAAPRRIPPALLARILVPRLPAARPP